MNDLVEIHCAQCEKTNEIINNIKDYIRYLLDRGSNVNPEKVLDALNLIDSKYDEHRERERKKIFGDEIL